ncbi:SCO family protein [Paenisporosarcina sp. FSL H8-0542]|uniref:SCO family protein n=1 Tax=Paenisporosarcina sp. FSL H8-0542 TaxID=2921401 RepID=UPI00315B2940
MNKNRYLIIALALVMLAGCNPQKTFQMESFAFTNQNEEEFGTEELKGKVWIADFIFTSCDTICPPMTASMATLQEKFREEEINVEFVSFSVDPTVDTPQKLNNYLKNFTDDDSNWNMLTGYSQEEIEIFARDEFQTLVQKPETSNQVIHGSDFFLVDQNGEIVGTYSFIQGDSTDELIKDVNRLF